MARLATGDHAVMAELVARYQRRVFGMIHRVTGRTDEAEDLFQEVWLRVARRAITFDPGRPFAPWLAGIATHVAIDWLRSRRPAARLGVVDDGAASDHAGGTDPRTALAEHERHAELASALDRLPVRLREAVLLRYFEDQSERDMAAALAVPTGTVKSRLHHALRALRDALAEEGSDGVA